VRTWNLTSEMCVLASLTIRTVRHCVQRKADLKINSDVSRRLLKWQLSEYHLF
jgi:hypothetical protein